LRRFIHRDARRAELATLFLILPSHTLTSKMLSGAKVNLGFCENLRPTSARRRSSAFAASPCRSNKSSATATISS
jgi:hypothetical protein